MRVSLRLLALIYILGVRARVAHAHNQKIWGRQSDLSSVPGYEVRS